jgi:cardiolipin synthase A/B
MPGEKNRNATEYSKVNNPALLRGGRPYFDRLLQMIETAKASIHLQTYIFDDDETGSAVANALKAAAQRKVQVYVLADGYASNVMSQTFINELREAGIHFRFFEPLFKSKNFYFGRRLHHKVVVTDAYYGLVGGINITNRYNDMPDKPAWLDFALYLEGSIATQLCALCVKTWAGFPAQPPAIPCEAIATPAQEPAPLAAQARIRRNDWVRRKNEISATYIDMLRTAQHEIILCCSYFLPGKVLRRQIQYAIKRGVSIKVIAAGYSDVKVAKHAERWLYDWLLRKGVALYEYQPNILHAKIATADNTWMTIGSYNINDISAYASIELNIDVRDSNFVTAAKQTLEAIIAKDCILITPENHVKTKNIVLQFIRWFSYQFIRTLFHLFTFYFKRKA